MVSNEFDFVIQKRQMIQNYLSEFIVGNEVYGRTLVGPDYQEACDQSQRNPVLLTILVAVQNARIERELANLSGNPDRIDRSVKTYEDAKYLENEYRYPGEAQSFEPEP